MVIAAIIDICLNKGPNSPVEGPKSLPEDTKSPLEGPMSSLEGLKALL